MTTFSTVIMHDIYKNIVIADEATVNTLIKACKGCRYLVTSLFAECFKTILSLQAVAVALLESTEIFRK